MTPCTGCHLKLYDKGDKMSEESKMPAEDIEPKADQHLQNGILAYV